MSTFLEKEIGIKLTSPKRVSSSGARLCESNDVFGIDLTISLKMASKLHLSLSSGIYCTELFQKIEQFQIDSGIIDEIEYIMHLLNSNSQTDRFTFSVCKYQKRNLSLALQLTKNIEDTDNDATVDDKSISQNYIYLNIMFQRIKNYTNILMKTFPNSHQKNNDFFIFNELMKINVNV